MREYQKHNVGVTCSEFVFFLSFTNVWLQTYDYAMFSDNMLEFLGDESLYLMKNVRIKQSMLLLRSI